MKYNGFVLGILLAGVLLAGCIHSTSVQTEGTATPVVQSGEPTVLPDGTMVKPDGTMVKPDGTMVKPDGTMIKPDGTIVKPDGVMVKPDGTMIKPDGTMVLPNGTMIKAEGNAEPSATPTAAAQEFSGTILAGNSAPLIDFNKADYDKALASGKIVFLYFYANWCPICRAEFPGMQEAFNELSTDKVIGFRVNYNDDETDEDEKNLARQFGVAYQHTKVGLKNGERVLKSPEGWDKQKYLSEINKLAAG